MSISNDRPLQRVLIVGGGSAGWMTAAYLNRFLRAVGCRITLVESPGIGTIGVGEATVPPMVEYVRELKLDEEDFMRRCKATYKLGIKFINWVEQDHAYWHPFGLCGGRIDGVDLFHYWARSLAEGHEEGPYSSYSLQCLLGETSKAPRPLRGGSPIIDSGSYAYHLDAAAMADCLKELATGEGVEHLYDEVSHVALDDEGGIASVKTAGGRSLTADLYVDCSGFRGVLIEQALGDPWIDWSPLLRCDRALVLPQHCEQMPPYTQATALSAGWLWKIPLSHRTGCGYVYSSTHTDEEVAVREMGDALDVKRGQPVEPRRLEFRVGRRTNSWVRNCVAIGLASGFLEPLESTGLMFVQRALASLLEHLPDRTCNPELIKRHNWVMAKTYEEVRDFILLHYLLVRRDDTEFWRDSRAVEPPASLQDRLTLYDETGIIDDYRAAVFLAPNYYHILAGAGRLPRRPMPRTGLSDPAQVAGILQQIKSQNRDWAGDMPTHRTLMEWLHDPSRITS